MLELLRSVIRTLNLVEVRGRDNMDRLLGCIVTLEQLCDNSAETKEETVNADKDQQGAKV